jgi:anti-sigma factor RsiW
MHDAWTDRLSEYIDGDLAAAQTAEIEAHLGECLACRNVLVGLRELARTTALLEDREPGRDLWPGILAEMRGAALPEPAAETAAIRSPGGRRTRRRFSFSVPQLLAASIAMMAVSATAMWLALGPGPEAPASIAADDRATQPQATLGPAAAVLISSVEQEYGQAIEELERTFDAGRSRLDPRTVRVVEENLRAIDEAIAEARAALARDPANGYLYRHLDQTMTKKVDLLRRATGATLAST